MVKLMILCSLLTAATASLGAHNQSAIKPSDAERLGLVATRIDRASTVAGELSRSGSPSDLPSCFSPSDLLRSVSPRSLGKTLSTEPGAGSPVVLPYPGLPDSEQNKKGKLESHEAINRILALRPLTGK